MTGFKYRPGDDLEKTTPIILTSRTNSIPGLAQYLARNPEILRDFFWSDGMVRVSGRELNGIMESPCYKGGKFSCLSCHSGHESDPNDMLASVGRTSAACIQCHDKFSQPSQLTAHTRHSPASSGSDCYNCHMPHTTYGVLKGIRSHQISSPRVLDDLQTGRPNACNLCHLDQTLDWTAQHLKGWYGHEVPELPEHGKSISHAVRLALVGDAGQRALIAWHLGWVPAQQTSGTNWFGPFSASSSMILIPPSALSLKDPPRQFICCRAAMITPFRPTNDAHARNASGQNGNSLIRTFLRSANPDSSLGLATSIVSDTPSKNSSPRAIIGTCASVSRQL